GTHPGPGYCGPWCSDPAEAQALNNIITEPRCAYLAQNDTCMWNCTAGLCGGPATAKCLPSGGWHSSLVCAPCGATTTAAPSSTVAKATSSASSSSNTGTIAGVIVGAVCGVTLLAVAVVFAVRWHHQRAHQVSTARLAGELGKVIREHALATFTLSYG